MPPHLASRWGIYQQDAGQQIKTLWGPVLIAVFGILHQTLYLFVKVRSNLLGFVELYVFILGLFVCRLL